MKNKFVGQGGTKGQDANQGKQGPAGIQSHDGLQIN